jgi:hypothetical protein
MAAYTREDLRKLEGEDLARMSRLSEEILGRVQEVAAMMHRLHGTPLHWDRFAIRPVEGSTADDVDVVIVVCNGDECGCHIPGENVCGPCPDL